MTDEKAPSDLCAALERAIQEIEDHNADYHHITPAELIGRMKLILAAARERPKPCP